MLSVDRLQSKHWQKPEDDWETGRDVSAWGRVSLGADTRRNDVPARHPLPPASLASRAAKTSWLWTSHSGSLRVWRESRRLIGSGLGWRPRQSRCGHQKPCTEAQAQAAPRDVRGLLPRETGDSTRGSHNTWCPFQMTERMRKRL